jgi:TRAP-type C4-dicarboxylate transport system permease small subunit
VSSTGAAGALDRSPSAARRIFFAVERWTTGIALVGACAMLALAACIGLYQVLSRFVLQEPAEWSEVSVRFALIWMTFLGIPLAFREGAMVCVDLLYRRSGRRMRRALDTLILAASLVLIGVIVWFGIDYTWRTRFQTIPGIESMTMVWAYSAMPVGGLFSILAILAQWFDPRRHDLETAQ